MAKNKKKGKQARRFEGMSYRETQTANSQKRDLLPKKERDWLKAHGYKNVGWKKVIELYQKLAEILKNDADDDTFGDKLESLFLDAERVGNKYQTKEEIVAFNQEMAAIAGEIADTIDKQFPEPEMEFVDYSQDQGQSRPVAVKTRRKMRRR